MSKDKVEVKQVVEKNEVIIERLQKDLLKQGYNVKKASEVTEEAKIKTNIFPIDYLLSGGISQCEGGHRIEFWGAESTGKTTFALHIIKQFQKKGKICVFVDAEDSFDRTWGSVVGLDDEKLIVIKPKNLEELGDMLGVLIPQVDLIVIDSIVSLPAEAELERDTNEPTMAIAARVNALITRKIYNTLANRNTVLIFINQMREKLGVMYGSPNTSGGGHALKHLYNTRIEFKVGKPIDIETEEDKERVGYEINLRCIKNKKGVPFKTSVVNLYFNGTIDNNTALFYAGIKYLAIEKSGNTYTFGKTKVVGKDNFLAEFKDWVDLEKEIWKNINHKNQ